MRAPVTCVGPVAEALRDALGASYLTYGLVSSLPVLMFGVVGFFAPVLFSRFSTKVGLFLVLSVLSFGLALRLIVALPALVLGTLLVGAGIAVLNTVIPVVLRHFFPGSVATALGIYTAATGCSSFAGSLLAIPLLDVSGSYATSLGVWVVLALPAAFFWFISPDKSLPDLRAPERKPISGQAFSLILTKLPVIGDVSAIACCLRHDCVASAATYESRDEARLGRSCAFSPFNRSNGLKSSYYPDDSTFRVGKTAFTGADVSFHCPICLALFFGNLALFCLCTSFYSARCAVFSRSNPYFKISLIFAGDALFIIALSGTRLQPCRPGTDFLRRPIWRRRQLDQRTNFPGCRFYPLGDYGCPRFCSSQESLKCLVFKECD